MTASEDFSFFTLEKPGAFFFIGTGKPDKPMQTLHQSDVNFNDDMVASGGHFWVKLVEDRLGVKLIK
jgi:hippurate hydrolase